MNRDRKSWCQEAEKRNRFWPCVCSLPFLVLLCVCCEKSLPVCVCAYVCMCICGDAEWLVLCKCACVCVIETVKSKRSEFLNIISSGVSRDCFFASVHQGGKIAFHCAQMCLCGKVRKMWEKEAPEHFDLLPPARPLCLDKGVCDQTSGFSLLLQTERV